MKQLLVGLVLLGGVAFGQSRVFCSLTFQEGRAMEEFILEFPEFTLVPCRLVVLTESPYGHAPSMGRMHDALMLAAPDVTINRVPPEVSDFIWREWTDAEDLQVWFVYTDEDDYILATFLRQGEYFHVLYE